MHVFLAGWLFALALVGPDPAPHRPGLPVRAAVLVLVVAAHDVFAKTLYARPPPVLIPAARRSGRRSCTTAAHRWSRPVGLLGREWLAGAAAGTRTLRAETAQAVAAANRVVHHRQRESSSAGHVLQRDAH